MAHIVDDKSEHCIPFILERIKSHRQQYEAKGETPPPFFVGLNGVQGAGKTTLVTTLASTLSSPPHSLPTVVLSIDDLYLPHTQQEALARSHSDNPLVQHRGQPSTHDVKLGTELFSALLNRQSHIKLPSYDKSAFSGRGDRRPENEWETVNTNGQQPVEVVVFEGWCVGFRALSDDEAEQKWKDAKAEYESKGDGYQGQLGKLQLEHVLFVNSKLREYDALTDQFGAFMHIDAEDAQYVYAWRLEQEAALRAAKGTGMTDEQVIKFVNGYYPAYELYTDVLRHGIFNGEKGDAGQIGPSASLQKVLQAAQPLVFYTILQKVDRTKPKKCVLNVATMQAVAVRAFQEQVIRAGTQIKDGKMPKDLAKVLRQYCGAVRDMDYMQEKANNGFDNDPFLLMSSKQIERDMMENHGLMQWVEQRQDLPVALDSKHPGLPGVGRTARIHAAQCQNRRIRRKLNMLSALAGGLALIVPMVIMKLVPGKICSLVTTCSFVFGFAVAIALLSDLRPNEILGVTAAYAAVLVVFVGTTSS
ncbi:hypothetical protein LTR65_007564 [Meristemomyces frigidus]